MTLAQVQKCKPLGILLLSLSLFVSFPPLTVTISRGEQTVIHSPVKPGWDRAPLPLSSYKSVHGRAGRVGDTLVQRESGTQTQLTFKAGLTTTRYV